MERLEIGQRIGDKQTLELIMRGNPPPEATQEVPNIPGGYIARLQPARWKK